MKSAFIKIYLEHKVLLRSIHLILKKNGLAEFFPMQSSTGNVTHDMCYVTRPDKWHVKYNVL